MPDQLKNQFPLRLLIGNEDCTFLLDSGFTFSSVDPGGFEMASFAIPKDMPQVIRGLNVRMDCGLGVAWEGRVSQVQRSLGNRTTITCEGYSALLKDQAEAEIFVDRDLTKWQSTTVAMQRNRVEEGYSPTGSSIAANETGQPALVESVTGPWESGSRPLVEALYDAQGIPIQDIIYKYTRGAAMGTGDTDWGWQIVLATTATQTSADYETFATPSSGEGNFFATEDNRTWATLQLFYTAAGGAANVLYALYWENIAVYGRHGMEAHEYEPVGFGFYPSQIAAWVLTKVPGLQRGVIQETDSAGYIVPHYVQLTPVTLDNIVSDMGKLSGWHWGVWAAESPLTGNSLPRLDFRPRPGQGEWAVSAQRGNMDTLDIREDLSEQYDEAVVTYSNVAGYSEAVRVKVANPILEEVGVSRCVVLNGGLMTETAATVFGEAALGLLNRQGRVAGTITCSQPLSIGSGGGPVAPWMVKPGIDRVRIVDLPSTDAFGAYNDVPVTRMEMSGSDQGWSTSLEIGQGANLVETLQSRLSAAAVLSGQGGV